MHKVLYAFPARMLLFHWGGVQHPDRCRPPVIWAPMEEVINQKTATGSTTCPLTGWKPSCPFPLSDTVLQTEGLDAGGAAAGWTVPTRGLAMNNCRCMRVRALFKLTSVPGLILQDFLFLKVFTPQNSHLYSETQHVLLTASCNTKLFKEIHLQRKKYFVTWPEF